MGELNISLIDNDFVDQAKTNVEFNDNHNNDIAEFFRQLQEELVTGQTATLEVAGLQKEAVLFKISRAE